MLVLSRKESQTITIGDDIEVTVVAIQGGRVKVGISAPRNVPIRRSELSPRLAPPLAFETTAAQLTDVLVELGENQTAMA